MAEDRVIYTDGRDVVVTNSTFKVRKTAYNLSGITRHCFWTIRPHRWPGALLFVIGTLLATAGYLGMIPSTWDVAYDGTLWSANMIAFVLGAVLAMIGILSLLISREKYAVRIGTAEGEKNAIVSTRKDYIIQIVDALHSAYDYHFTTQSIIQRK